MNLLPGHGLGFTGSKELAFGLGAVSVVSIPIFPPVLHAGGGGWGGSYYRHHVAVHDNAYSRRDDTEIIELLSVLFQVIE